MQAIKEQIIYSPLTGRVHNKTTLKALGYLLRVRSGTKYWRTRIVVGDETIQPLIHHLAWYFTNGEWPPTQMDHRNLDGLDNRIKNLRLDPHDQNNQNRKLQRNNKSGVKGVYFHNGVNKWASSITLDNKKYHLGTFDDINEAEAAVREARERMHGEFANHGDKGKNNG